MKKKYMANFYLPFPLIPKSVICLEIVRWTSVGAPDPDPLFSVSSLARTETVVFGDKSNSETCPSFDESFPKK